MAKNHKIPELKMTLHTRTKESWNVAGGGRSRSGAGAEYGDRPAPAGEGHVIGDARSRGEYIGCYQSAELVALGRTSLTNQRPSLLSTPDYVTVSSK